MAEVTPTVAAAGPISIPVRKLVELVAESRAFQARCGVASQAAAYPFIHHPHVKADDDLDGVKRPCAVVETKSFGLKRVNNWHLRPDSPTLTLILTDDDRHPAASDLSQTDFENFVGQVVADLAALQGQDTRLAIEAVRQVGPSALSHPQTAGQGKPYWVAVFDVVWSRL